jgi:hypothetical protein
MKKSIKKSAGKPKVRARKWYINLFDFEELTIFKP